MRRIKIAELWWKDRKNQQNELQGWLIGKPVQSRERTQASPFLSKSDLIPAHVLLCLVFGNENMPSVSTAFQIPYQRKKFSLSAFPQVMQMANQREKNGRLQGGEEEQKARKP